MPIYEYKCQQCGHEFERQVSIVNPPDPSEIRCPRPYERTVPLNGLTGEPLVEVDNTCGGECKRLISKTSFILKGGGWFKDGY